jgi:hypothetical protein
MFPLIADVASLWCRDLLRHRHLIFPAMDVNLRMREIRNAAGVIAVEMRQQQMPDIVGRIAQRLDLPHRGLGRIQPRRRLPNPSTSKPHRLRDVAKANAGVDQRQAVIGLDQQAVTHQTRPLEDAAGAVHQTPPDRTHGAGVEVMDLHDEPFFLAVRALACHSPCHR